MGPGLPVVTRQRSQLHYCETVCLRSILEMNHLAFEVIEGLKKEQASKEVGQGGITVGVGRKSRYHRQIVCAEEYLSSLAPIGQ